MISSKMLMVVLSIYSENPDVQHYVDHGFTREKCVCVCVCVCVS